MPGEVNPEVALTRFYGNKVDRLFAVELLREAIEVANKINPSTWSVTLTPSYIRLNTGRVEVFALHPDQVHFVCDRRRLPAGMQPDDAEDTYESIPGSTYIDLTLAETCEAIERIRGAWHSAIESGAMSARTAVYRRYHSQPLLAHLQRLYPNLPTPKWEAAVKPQLNEGAFSRLADRFLERVTDFGDFTDRSGGYWTEERAYKLELGTICRETLTATLFEGADDDDGAADIVSATSKALTTRLPSTQAAQNLAGWRYHDFLRHLAKPAKKTFAKAFRDLLHGDEPSPARVQAYTKRTWPLMQKAQGGNPYAQTRMFPTLFLMAMYPRTDVAVRTDLFQRASRELLGRPILESKPLDAEQYESVLELCAAVWDNLDRRGWLTTDMIDVHSFLWVATRDRDTD